MFPRRALAPRRRLEFHSHAMKVAETEIPDVKIIAPKKFCDGRGFFSETYNKESLGKAGIGTVFVQDNQSLSSEAGVVRGLHFQTPPYAQAKLVRVTRGAIFDVALDLRRDSPTFKHHVSRVISAADWNQMYIPVGFAHGFCTLEPETEVIYKVSALYAPDHEGGVLWNDPDLEIAWPYDIAEAVVSDKDKKLPVLRDIVATLPF